ncbi:two-component sensor histidine kinase [Enterobacterales bacterium CwR94]|nr:two-component sensor histidine kinase [Enterobacterales bacterium CwR94]
MKLEPLPVPSQTHRRIRLLLMAIVMVAIYILDSITNYEIAVSMFYTVVILTAARVVDQRALWMLTGACIGITVLSFVSTPQGNYRAGVLNMMISILSIVITGYLVSRMEAARAAAHYARERLLRISRERSLEGLTTLIAHEINQPLAAIVTSGNACQRWLRHPSANLEKAEQALTRILNDAHRASDIIARVRALTKGEPPQKTAFAFNQAIKEVVTQSKSDMTRNGITLTLTLMPSLPAALGDRVQIQQVMANLIINAIDATVLQTSAPRTISIRSCQQDAMLVFTIVDSGIGLSAEAHAHLFEAFWTTKEQGLGVGLSLCRTIIDANGGHIWAEPQPHGGACFAFRLPTFAEESPE